MFSLIQAASQATTKNDSVGGHGPTKALFYSLLMHLTC
jgi:hypothetical protein